MLWVSWERPGTVFQVTERHPDTHSCLPQIHWVVTGDDFIFSGTWDRFILRRFPNPG